MNDFTKEELEDLSYCVGYAYNHEHELANKIESMIDNYCSHDGEIGKDYPAEKCMKCGAIW